MRSLTLAVALVHVLLFSTTIRVHAQDSDPSTYTILYTNVQLDDALEELVSATKINLLYDPDLTVGLSISCTARKKTPEAILKCIVDAANLDYYRLSSGTYVIIEKPEEPPQFGNLAGIVVDKQTGDPLPYANVLLSDASTGTATNNAGMFTFASLVTGPHEIVTTYIGYEPSVDSVWITPNSKSRQLIELAPSAIVADPIIVNGITQRLPSEGLGKSSKELNSLKLPTSLVGDDPLYSASSIMNVGVRPPFVDLHIQGGEAGEHQILLDGVPVFEPISLGRLMGAFSPLAVGRITVHKAGFSAPLGSQLSGLLNIEQNVSTRENEAFSAQIDPLSVNGRANFKVDLPGSASTEVMVAGRTSYWTVFQYNALDNLLQDWNSVDPLLSSTAIASLQSDQALFTPHRHGSDVSFSDLHVASNITINPFHKLFVAFYNGTNEVGSELFSSEAADVTEGDFFLLTQDRYKWANTTGQVRYNWLMGARSLGMLRVRNSLHTLRHNYQYQDSIAVDNGEALNIAQLEQSLLTKLNQSVLPDDKNRINETAIEGTFDYGHFNRQPFPDGLTVHPHKQPIQVKQSFLYSFFSQL